MKRLLSEFGNLGPKYLSSKQLLNGMMSILIYNEYISTNIVFDYEGKILCSRQFIEKKKRKDAIFDRKDTLLND